MCVWLDWWIGFWVGVGLFCVFGWVLIEWVGEWVGGALEFIGD